MALSLVSSISGVAAAPAWADGLDPNIRTLVELEAGASFDSNDGWFTFSDFDLTAVGFDDSAFDQYLDDRSGAAKIRFALSCVFPRF